MTNWDRRWTSLIEDKDGIEPSGELQCAACRRGPLMVGERILLVRQPDRAYLVYCESCGRNAP